MYLEIMAMLTRFIYIGNANSIGNANNEFTSVTLLETFVPSQDILILSLLLIICAYKTDKTCDFIFKTGSS